MGRSRQPSPPTPLLDSVVRVDGIRLALTGDLKLSAQENARLVQELAELAERFDGFWKTRTPPPETYSAVLPYPLGVPRDRNDEDPQSVETASASCHPRHKQVWNAASLAKKVLRCLYEHSLTPAQLGAGRPLSPRSLIDHLEGRSILHPEVANDWAETCDDFPVSTGAALPLFFSGRRVYRWPDLPDTLAGLQANLFYPVLLADGQVSAMWMDDALCLCWVTGRVGVARGLLRSPPVHSRGTWVGAKGIESQQLAANAFHPDFWRGASVGQLVASVEAEPAAFIGRYLRWYVERKRDGWLQSMKDLAAARPARPR